MVARLKGVMWERGEKKEKQRINMNLRGDEGGVKQEKFRRIDVEGGGKWEKF